MNIGRRIRTTVTRVRDVITIGQHRDGMIEALRQWMKLIRQTKGSAMSDVTQAILAKCEQSSEFMEEVVRPLLADREELVKTIELALVHQHPMILDKKIFAEVIKKMDDTIVASERRMKELGK